MFAGPVSNVSIRIGGVPYGVGAPLLAGMEEDSAVTLVKLPPTRLIEQLRRGELDAALVSSIEAIRCDGYQIARGLGIACKTEVRSVRAFRRRGSLIGSVGLDASSATSVALLRVLLARPLAAEVAPGCSFASIAPTTAPAALPHDLVLLIGDAGLAADAGDRDIWDLGKLWRQWTGMPFVFALWLLRPGADGAAILPALRRARERGRHRREVDGTFGAVHYDLDAEDLRGLQRFFAETTALGLAEAAARPVFIGTDSTEGADQ